MSSSSVDTVLLHFRWLFLLFHLTGSSLLFVQYIHQVAFVLYFYSQSPQCCFVYLLEDESLVGLARLFSALHHEVSIIF
jgi:hypothetical protein